MLTGGGSMLRGLEELVRGEDRSQYHDSGRTDAGGGYRNRTVCRICRRAKRLLMEEIKGYVEHIVYRNEDNGIQFFI